MTLPTPSWFWEYSYCHGPGQNLWFIYLFIYLPACLTRPALSFETGFHIAQTAFGLLPHGAGIARMCPTATVMGSSVLPSSDWRPWYGSWTSASFFIWCFIKRVEQRLCIQCFHLCVALDFTIVFPAPLCCWLSSPQKDPWFAFISPLSLYSCTNEAQYAVLFTWVWLILLTMIFASIHFHSKE